jgi:spermidine synthase
VTVERRLTLAIGALGFTSIIAQTILLREFLSVFAGNELVLGIVLANWMVLTGLGAFLGRSSDRIVHGDLFLVILFSLVAIVPVAAVFTLDSLRNVVFPVGSMVGIGEGFCASFVLLVPFCVPQGFLFTLLAGVVSHQTRSNRIAGVYSIEALGCLLGGLLFNFVMVVYLTTYQSLLVLGLCALGVALALSLRHKNRVAQSTVVLLAGVVVIALLSLDIDGAARRLLFRDQEVLFYRDTPYGNLTVTKQGNEKNFFENGVLLFSTNDPAANEEEVHYAMIQHPRPKRVLLVSGGIAGTTREILKYGVNRIDYVELNPWLVDIGKQYTNALDDPRIQIVAEDARRYIRTTPERYDVALINVPDPATAQINRYFTLEFFEELKLKLTNGAVISVSLLPSSEYMGPAAREVSSITYNTLRSVFRHVLIIPGLKNYYVASDRELNIDVTRMVSERGINTLYVNRFYLDDQMLRDRSAEIMRNLDGAAQLNRDMTPVAYYRQLLYWLSYFHFDLWVPAAVGAVVFLTMIANLTPVSFGMFVGGFAASSVEILLLVSFQVIYGYVYQAIGIIIMVFMAGLATGGWIPQQRSLRIRTGNFIAVQCITAVYCLILPLVLSFMRSASSGESAIYGIFLALTFSIAVMTGMLFGMATSLLKGTHSSVASTLYGIDLLGSAVGALAVSAYLIPLFGLVRVCVGTGLLSFTGAIVTSLSRKKISTV